MTLQLCMAHPDPWIQTMETREQDSSEPIAGNLTGCEVQAAAQGSAGLALSRQNQAPAMVTLQLRLVSCTARIAFSHIPFLQAAAWMGTDIVLVPQVGNALAGPDPIRAPDIPQVPLPDRLGPAACRCAGHSAPVALQDRAPAERAQGIVPGCLGVGRAMAGPDLTRAPGIAQVLLPEPLHKAAWSCSSSTCKTKRQ